MSSLPVITSVASIRPEDFEMPEGEDTEQSAHAQGGRVVIVKRPPGLPTNDFKEPNRCQYCGLLFQTVQIKLSHMLKEHPLSLRKVQISQNKSQNEVRQGCPQLSQPSKDKLVSVRTNAGKVYPDTLSWVLPQDDGSNVESDGQPPSPVETSGREFRQSCEVENTSNIPCVTLEDDSKENIDFDDEVEKLLVDVSREEEEEMRKLQSVANKEQGRQVLGEHTTNTTSRLQSSKVGLSREVHDEEQSNSLADQMTIGQNAKEPLEEELFTKPIKVDDQTDLKMLSKSLIMEVMKKTKCFVCNEDNFTLKTLLFHLFEKHFEKEIRWEVLGLIGCRESVQYLTVKKIRCLQCNVEDLGLQDFILHWGINHGKVLYRYVKYLIRKWTGSPITVQAIEENLPILHCKLNKNEVMKTIIVRSLPESQALSKKVEDETQVLNNNLNDEALNQDVEDKCEEVNKITENEGQALNKKMETEGQVLNKNNEDEGQVSNKNIESEGKVSNKNIESEGQVSNKNIEDEGLVLNKNVEDEVLSKTLENIQKLDDSTKFICKGNRLVGIIKKPETETKSQPPCPFEEPASSQLDTTTRWSNFWGMLSLVPVQKEENEVISTKVAKKSSRKQSVKKSELCNSVHCNSKKSAPNQAIKGSTVSVESVKNNLKQNLSTSARKVDQSTGSKRKVAQLLENVVGGSNGSDVKRPTLDTKAKRESYVVVKDDVYSKPRTNFRRAPSKEFLPESLNCAQSLPETTGVNAPKKATRHSSGSSVGSRSSFVGEGENGQTSSLPKSTPSVPPGGCRKLNLAEISNIYSRHSGQLKTRSRSKSNEPTFENDDWTYKKEKTLNVSRSFNEPYCSICQLLADNDLLKSRGMKNLETVGKKIPKKSVVWLPTENLKTESLNEESKDHPGDSVSSLITCRSCSVCVHSSCYRVDEQNKGPWKCDRCKVDCDAACCLCLNKGGLLKRTTDSRLVHVCCALLIPEVFYDHNLLDLSHIPGKRSQVTCLVCGQKEGRPIIHCGGSKCCMVSYHPYCGIMDGVEVYIDRNNKLSTRCVVCSQKNKKRLEKQAPTFSKFSPPDIEVGETIIVKETGKKGKVISIIPEDYCSVAFDDGFYCDNICPDDVALDKEHSSSDKTLTNNDPVLVRWNGKRETGVYKGRNTLHWYKIKFFSKEKSKEFDRSKITKLK